MALPASPHPAARLVPLLAVFLALSLTALGIVLDAHLRRVHARGRDRVVHAAVRAVGSDLALHSASRWLRHPTRSEPWAAAQDGPAMLDQDPAGALAPPPVKVLREGWPRGTLTR